LPATASPAAGGSDAPVAAAAAGGAPVAAIAGAGAGVAILAAAAAAVFFATAARRRRQRAAKLPRAGVPPSPVVGGADAGGDDAAMGANPLLLAATDRKASVNPMLQGGKSFRAGGPAAGSARFALTPGLASAAAVSGAASPSAAARGAVRKTQLGDSADGDEADGGFKSAAAAAVAASQRKLGDGGAPDGGAPDGGAPDGGAPDQAQSTFSQLAPIHARSSKPGQANAEAGLPDGWTAAWSNSKSTWYWRSESGEVTWEKPLKLSSAKSSRTLGADASNPDTLPPGWTERFSRTNQRAYWTHEDGQVAWEKP
jgi:hypothetical protein